MKLLVVSPQAAVRLPECVRRTPHGFFAVSSRGAPLLYAAARGRFITGPLTPFLVNLLLPGASASAVAARHAVPPAILQESVQTLSALGVWQAGHPASNLS